MSPDVLRDVITQMEQSMPYGTIHLTIKRHDSMTTTIDGQKVTSHRVDGNERALAVVIALLKAAQATRETGSLTVTMILREGQSHQLLVQDAKRVNG